MHYVDAIVPPANDKAVAAAMIYIDGLVGALQWCSGSNLPDLNIGTVRSSIFALKSSHVMKNGRTNPEKYHFKLYWHGMPTKSINIDELNAGIFDAFETLCSDEKVQMCYDQPFEFDINNREATVIIVSKIREELQKLSGEYAEPVASKPKKRKSNAQSA